MPEPIEHARHRGFIETILRHIPGFHGYLEKEYRRDSDALQREWLADRLQHAKRSVDNLSGLLAEAGQIDALPQIDRLRARLDQLLARVRGAMRGYSGWFDLVQIKEDTLDRIYRHDINLIDEVDALARAVEQLPEHQQDMGAALADASAKTDALERLWDAREDLLKGVD